MCSCVTDITVEHKQMLLIYNIVVNNKLKQRVLYLSGIAFHLKLVELI